MCGDACERRARVACVAILAGIVWACSPPLSDPSQGPLDRQAGDAFQLRVMSWNVKYGSIFPPNGRRQQSFANIVRAVDPDVLILQEVDPGEVVRLTVLMDRVVPLGDSHGWEIHGASDNVIISRYPLQKKDGELVVPYPLPHYNGFRYGQAMALVDIPDDVCDVDVYVIAMHNRSRAGVENASRRQVQSDAVMRWVRELRDEHTIPRDTPIVIAGDLNVHPGAPAAHLVTLVTGDIADEATFGADIRPDWDGTDLADASPSHNGEGRVFYTWRDDSEDFPPGRLSRILFTDSVLTLEYGFVVNTVELDKADLGHYGLRRDDSLLDGKPGIFDHMPLIADFAPRATGCRLNSR